MIYRPSDFRERPRKVVHSITSLYECVKIKHVLLKPNQIFKLKLKNYAPTQIQVKNS